MSELHDLLEDVLRFRDERHWKQFHTPRNLAAGLAIEAAELQETLLWMSDPEVAAALQDPKTKDKIRDEIADVLIFALLFGDAANIDLTEAVRHKLAVNAQKYPVDLSRGSARKYTDLQE